MFIKSHLEAIPSEIIMKLASDIASGMNMMNSSGIVHRDLKSFSFFSFLFSFLFIFFLFYFYFYFQFSFENQINALFILIQLTKQVKYIIRR